MNIGILGSGHVGGTLGERWAKLGHHVFFGSREPHKLTDLVKRSGATARAVDVPEAVQSAEIVVVALPWGASKKVLESLDLKGKILLDCMNPLLPDLSGLELGTTTSAGEKVAEWARGAKVVKIFNTTGYNNMANPDYGGERSAMFYCGDDTQAKEIARLLAAELGFEPVDSGPLSNARLLEPLAMLWIWLALKGGIGRDIAFRLLKR
ncbi:MAG TPA: NADPH-dependent F420 reductase [Bryobacteraceae bacterium]|nr:NADPH-dependent F420 reductase [Bryobacteraceae bacterium]